MDSYFTRRLIRLRARWQRLCIEVTLREIWRDIEDLDEAIRSLNHPHLKDAWNTLQTPLNAAVKAHTTALKGRHQSLQALFEQDLPPESLGSFLLEVDSQIDELEQEIHASETMIRMQYAQMEFMINSTLDMPT